MKAERQTGVTRALGKVRRSARLASEIVRVLASGGLVAARHAWAARRGLQLGRWNAVREGLRAGLELAAGPATPLRRVAEAVGSPSVVAIEFERSQANRGGLAVALEHVPLREILSLYAFYRYFGDFRIAEMLRAAALDAALRRQQGRRHALIPALTAALERGEPALALELLSTRTIRRRDREEARAVRAMAYALAGEPSRARELWERDLDPSDAGFGEFLAGRSVAVVGPAPPEYEAGPEIDSFDVVVRTNYRVGSNHPVEKYGTRTDVSYYNHHRMRFHRDEVLEVGRTLPWVVLKSRADEAGFRAGCPSHEAARTAFLADPVLFGDAHPMAIQNILADLLHFGPARLKLFGTTFYGTRRSYSEGYRAVPLDGEIISQSLRFHELFSCRAFVQNVRSAGLCEADELTASVLDMSRVDYAANIQERYGAYTY